MRLYQDPWFTFRFTEDRLIPRFHLEGVQPGRLVRSSRSTLLRVSGFGLLATATVGEDGWVDLTEPIIVRAGEAFIAVPEPGRLNPSPGKMPVNAMGVAGLLASVGYFSGLAQGGGNELVLAVCGAALGAFVVLLGYGPVALVLGALDAFAKWFHGKKE